MDPCFHCVVRVREFQRWATLFLLLNVSSTCIELWCAFLVVVELILKIKREDKEEIKMFFCFEWFLSCNQLNLRNVIRLRFCSAESSLQKTQTVSPFLSFHSDWSTLFRKKQEKNLSWITKGNKNLEEKIGTKLKPKANFNPGSFLCWRLVGQTQPMPMRLFKTGKKAASGSFVFVRQNRFVNTSSS